MSRLVLERIRTVAPGLLAELAEYDLQAFGPAGLRTCDLAVAVEAGAVYIAQVDDEMVGSCQLLRMLDEPPFLYLLGFYVLPGHQGHGLGRVFLEELIDECRRLQAEGLLLTVSPENVRALGLYRQLGFVEEDYVADFYGPGEDRHVLRLRF